MTWAESHPYKSALIAGIVTSFLSILVLAIQKDLSLELYMAWTPFVFAVTFSIAGLSDLSERFKNGNNK